jgi:phospholipase/carboxylesterase
MSGLELQTVEIETGPSPQASVIWLHGLGADGHDFEPIVPALAPFLPPTRFIFPHAPVRPVTVNGGMPMRAWYDIVSFDRSPPRDREGVESSRAALERLVAREEARGVPDDAIVVAGFSQGGALALYTGLRLDRTLAGLMGLSTYLLFSGELESARCAASNTVPVFVAHGTYDPVVPFMAGQHVARTLRDLGYEVEWHEYPMPHAVCPEEVGHIGAWLSARLRDTGAHSG